MSASRARRVSISAALCLILVAAIAPAAAADTPPPYPNRMAATGDSITRAFNTCRFPFTDCIANSWSTGTSTTVNSHYLRLRTLNPAIDGQNYNRAVSGAKMADLWAQMGNVLSLGPVDYVTVLLGGNDLCTPTTGEMTSVINFDIQLRAGLDRLRSGGSNALVYLVSVPDVYNLWAILKDNSSARSAWDSYDICQSLLADPLSTDPDDQQRRVDVRERNEAYNAIIEGVCSDDVNCVTDGGLVFDTKFVPQDVSTRDYFHPSVEGLRRLSEVTWTAGPWGGPVPTMHVGDLDGKGEPWRNGWRAIATVEVHTETEATLGGATVSGSWSNGSSGSCTTGIDGRCSVSLSLGKRVTSVTFSVTHVTAAGYNYLSTGNHDSETDSNNGTSITISKP